MIKNILAVAVIVSLTSYTTAASIVVSEVESGANTIYSIMVDPGADAGGFDTMIVKATPDAGDFLDYNPSGTAGFTPLSPADEQTFLNALLAAPVSFGGLGFNVLDSGSSASGISTTIGSLGNNAASDSPVFLFNAVLPTDVTGTVTIDIVDDGNIIASLSESLGIVPEPTTAIMLALGVVGFAARRRM